MTTADQAVRARAAMGISEHDMSPGWRVIVARSPEQSHTWYHHVNDDPRLVDALRQQASEWLAERADQ